MVRTAILSLTLFLAPLVVHAQDSGVPLRDVNGDGAVSITAFGDSITYGVGDSAPGGGYPRRLRLLLGVPVTNAGVPGEELVATGIYRVPGLVSGSKPDTLIILEGANDAVKRVSEGEYSRALQKAINVTRASGKDVVVVTPLPPTGDHAPLGPFTSAYANVARDLARVNGYPLADAERAWTLMCPDIETCPLYNLPEGLHPNGRGYDALAQTIAAAFVGVDLFTPTGPAELESALGLPAGSVIVRGGSVQ